MDKPHLPSRARPTCASAQYPVDYSVNDCLLPDASKLLPFRKEIPDLTNYLIYLSYVGNLFNIISQYLAQSTAYNVK